MIPTLVLPLCALLLQGPGHAALHPVQADVFLEVGDVSALLTALEQAPVVRLLRDERLKALFAKLEWKAELPLPELAGQVVGDLLPAASSAGWLPGLKTISASLTVQDPAQADGEPLALLVLADLGSPEQAAALFGAVLANAPKHEPYSSALPGAERLHVEAQTSEDFWCAQVGPRVVLGTMLTKVEDYHARADHQLAGLDSNETFKKELAQLDPNSGAPQLWFVLGRSIVEMAAAARKPDAEKGVTDFLSKIPPEWNPLGSPRVMRMSFSGGRFLTDVVTTEVSAGGEARAVDPSWLEPVPSGSMLVYASAFDGAGLGRRLRELLAKDEDGRARLQALEEKLGFGPEKVLARLGPGMTVAIAPLAGVGLPESRAWIDCEDAAAFTKEFEALVKALGETLPGYEASTKPYKVKVKGSDEKVEVPVTTLKLPEGLIPIPMISVSPSFAPVGKRLVFALNSMDVKNELKHVHGGGESSPSDAKPLAAYGVELPANVQSILVMDWGQLFSSVLGTTKAFAAMAPPEQMPIDVKLLPDGKIFTDYIKPTLHYARAASGGTRRRNEASIGPETWIGLALAFARSQPRAVAPSAPAPAPGADGK